MVRYTKKDVVRKVDKQSTARNTPPKAAPPAPDLTPEVSELHEEVVNRALEGDLVGFSAPPAAGQKELAENWRKVQELKHLLDLHARRAKDAETKAEDARRKHEDEIGSLQIQQRELEAAQAGLEPEREKLRQQQEELSTLQMQLKQKELDAEAALTAQKRALLTDIEAEVGKFRDTVSTLARSMVDERSTAIKELQVELTALRTAEQERLAEDRRLLLTQISDQQEELDEQRTALARERESFRTERAALRQAQARLEADQALLQEDRAALDTKVARLVNARSSNLAADLRSTQDLLQKAQSEREQLAQQLMQRAETDARLKGRTSEDLLRDLEALRRDNEDLRRELADRPTEDEVIRLRALDRERHDWEVERIELKRRAAELECSLGRYQTSVIDLETLRDQKVAYEASNKLLRKLREELTSDIELRVSQGNQKDVFPACLAMDRESLLQEDAQTEAVTNLPRLVEDLQQRMAFDPATRTKLYYTLADVRSFLAGLAMSRLILIQGVSGTGKTSLPLSFARAIGGGQAFVEVQAGWRDRQDLIGHFNSFENKFYESKFLHALYEAQCPSYRDRPYLIILDEMNLSHAEQYFADLIAALELPDETSRRLELLTGPLPEGSVPKLLVNNGRTLKLPTNVWFVGTANQDETTKDFADKTYDRAHIMELPVTHPNFQVRVPKAAPPRFSCTSLRQVFAAAKQQHEEPAGHAYRFLEDNLREFMGIRFRVGWGNRLKRQIEDYVPVVLAAGGSLGEAMDYLIASKIVRKIRNRYENRVSDLDALHDHLLNVWPKLDGKQVDSDSSKLLLMVGEELRRVKTNRANESE